VRDNAILRAVAEAAREFLQNEEWEQVAVEILGRLGRAAEVCRVAVFANVLLDDGRPATQLRYEWTMPAIPPRLHEVEEGYFYPPHPQKGSRFERWYTLLSENVLLHGPVSSFPQEEREALEALGIRSTVAVPIFVQQHWWGFVTFDACMDERSWTEGELEALKAATNILAAAIERQKMVGELRQRAEEVHLLSEVLRALNAVPHIDAAFPRMVPALRKLTACDRLSIALLEENNEWFTITNLDEPSPALGMGSRMRVRATAAADDILRGCLHETPDLAQEAHYPGEKALFETGFRSRVNIPLRAEDHVYGALNVAWRRVRGYRPGQLPLLQRVADAITLAIERSRYLAEEKRQREETENLYQAAVALTTNLKLECLLEEVLDYLANVTHYDSASILLQEEDSLRVAAMRGFEQPEMYKARRYSSDEPYLRKIRDSGQPVVLTDASSSPDFENWDGHYPIRGWVGVPLIARGNVIGYLTLESRTPAAFGPHEVRLAEIFAASAAPVIENARLYRQAVQLNEELKKALETRTNLLHHVSHELRTPLTLILGVAELLESSAEEQEFSESTRLLIEHLVREARHLRTMVNQILRLKSIQQQPFEVQPVLVSTWLEQIRQMWAPRMAKKSQSLQVSLAPDVSYVLGNPGHLQQVLDNLLDNAYKYTPEGKRILLDVRREGDDVIFRVQDEGIGVSPEDLGRLFEQFYRGKGAEQTKTTGLGIGLSLCKAIVERHRGRIWAESPGKGQGLTVIFTLPAGSP